MKIPIQVILERFWRLLMDDDQLVKANKDRLAKKNADYMKRVFEELEKETRNKGTYLGFYASEGKHKVKLVDGSVVWGNLISNGAIETGALVQVTIPEQGGIPLIKAMPG